MVSCDDHLAHPYQHSIGRRGRHGHRRPQHSARHVGPAPGRRDGVRRRRQRPHAVARRAGRPGRPLLTGVVSGPALHAGACVVHDRALRPRPRRVHQLVRDPTRQPDLRLGPAGGRLPHRPPREGPPLPRRAAHRPPHGRHGGPARSARDSPRSSRRATSSSGRSPPATPTTSPAAGLLDAYKKHIADRSYQGENEDGQNATKCVPMWDSTPMPIPLESYVDAWHGQQAVEWIERYERPEPFFLFVGFPGPHDPWDAPAEAVERYRGVDISMPSSTRRPDDRGHGPLRGAAELVPVALRLRDDDRRRHPGHADVVRRRHLGHRPGRRRHGRRAASARACSTTRGSSTPATTAKWAATTA